MRRCPRRPGACAAARRRSGRCAPIPASSNSSRYRESVCGLNQATGSAPASTFAVASRGALALSAVRGGGGQADASSEGRPPPRRRGPSSQRRTARPSGSSRRRAHSLSRCSLRKTCRRSSAGGMRSQDVGRERELGEAEAQARREVSDEGSVEGAALDVGFRGGPGQRGGAREIAFPDRRRCAACASPRARPRGRRTSGLDRRQATSEFGKRLGCPRELEPGSSQVRLGDACECGASRRRFPAGGPRPAPLARPPDARGDARDGGPRQPRARVRRSPRRSPPEG